MAHGDPEPRARSWHFLTNHAHVLLSVVQEPTIRVREVAAQVGITERAAQGILRDLQEEGYLRARRVGRRNVYSVRASTPLRHPLHEHHHVGELLALLS